MYPRLATPAKQRNGNFPFNIQSRGVEFEVFTLEKVVVMVGKQITTSTLFDTSLPLIDDEAGRRWKFIKDYAKKKESNKQHTWSHSLQYLG